VTRSPFLPLPGPLHILWFGNSQRIERIGHRLQMTTRQMQVDRGIGELRVTEQHLDSAKIGACFVQMRGEAMAQGVLVLLMICIPRRSAIAITRTMV
jgi:hypothetical protein